jgi:S-adenosylmethionine synthetase
MIERVNPSHPDKIADRIAGAIVDLAYKKQENPKIAVEVLIGHGNCYIITETSVSISLFEAEDIVSRITGREMTVRYHVEPQDPELAKNQAEGIRCGDNGIFKGVPMNEEENTLLQVTQELYHKFPTDGKFIYDADSSTFIACQSCAHNGLIEAALVESFVARETPVETVIINPLGEWTGGTNVDTGATNRKLGSDMGRAVTGGGLHGKDLSKADVSVNIACFILAQKYGVEIEAKCAIGDEQIAFIDKSSGNVTMHPYSEVVEKAREYIERLGGFEKLAEWGLI